MWKTMQDVYLDYLPDDEKFMTYRKQPIMSIDAIRLKFRLSVYYMESLFPKSFFYRVSTKPLASLNRTSVKDLLVNVPSEGNYLLLRTLDPPAKRLHSDHSILVPVEDHLGNASMCCLYGYVYLEDVPPVYTVFALKEPCLKYCSFGNFAVVVGSPSDFIKIDRSHALAKDVENLVWRSKTTSEEDSQADSKLASEWKVKGNDHFGKGKFGEAKEAYLVALGCARESEIEHVLHLNLAAVYLSEGFYELTIKHAKKVLEKDPNNEKALFRAGRANYELKQYSNAKQYFQDLLSKYPSNTKAASELDRCLSRLEEGSGKIDMYRLYTLNRLNPVTQIDCGTYVGPVKISCKTGKTRGLFASENLNPGTLILVEKSVDASFDSSTHQDQGIWKDLRNAARTVYRNPRTFGKQIYSIRNGMSEVVFCDEELGLEPIVDVRRLITILQETGFLTQKKTDYRFPEFNQMFPIALAINHSCMPNSTFFIYNDIILVRTCSFISKGEEVTVSHYLDNMSYCRKQYLLKMQALECECLLCETDAKEAADIHIRREALCNDMNTLVNGNFRFPVERFLEIVKLMEETYNNRSLLRVYLFRVYLPVACLFINQGAEGWEKEFMACIEKGLEAVGISVDLLLQAAENEESSLPGIALLGEELFGYASLMAQKESICRRNDQVSRWIKVLKFLEGVFRGGNIEMLRDRFRDQKILDKILSEVTDIQ